MRKKDQQFRALIWDFYQQNGRHWLPWRQTQDPYAILVSELMLQQTQVARVVPKFQTFTDKWPTVQALAQASLGEVLVMWQGLGYNRRAKFLHQCAIAVVNEYDSVFPRSQTELESLPGIGPYTASAICAFAYNQPVTLIETNVRRVFIHHYFADATTVADAELLPLIERVLPKDQARVWYAALMDYGSYLKTQVPNPNRKSSTYSRQSTFKGSDRQIRGAVLRLLADGKSRTKQMITEQLLDFDSERVTTQIEKLFAEGLLQKSCQTYHL